MQTSVLRQQVFRPASTSQRAARRPAITCAVPEQQQQRWEAPGLKQLAVGLAAATLLHSAPADAGVILQKTSTKKLFQSEPVERVKAEASKAASEVTGGGGGGGGVSLPKVNLPSGGGGPTLSQLTLPLAVGGIAVGALGWKQVDPGFSAFFDDALAKNSNNDGAGYEQLLKSGENMRKGAKSNVKKGTKKIFGKKR